MPGAAHLGAIASTMGAFGLLVALTGLGPIFGVIGLMNIVGYLYACPPPSCGSGSGSGSGGLGGSSKFMVEGTGSTRVESPEGFVWVDDLEIGMQIMGVTAQGVQDHNCNVVAIGSNGEGDVYGNYMSHHFVLNENETAVSAHGENGELRTDSLFDVLLDCSFGVDEAGTKFSAMADYNSTKEDSPPPSPHQLALTTISLSMKDS